MPEGHTKGAGASPPPGADLRTQLSPLFEKLYARLDLLVAVLRNSQLTGASSSEERYVTTIEMATLLGMSGRQFRRAFSEGPHKDALQAVAIKRGIKQWRWPVKKVMKIMTTQQRSEGRYGT